MFVNKCVKFRRIKLIRNYTEHRTQGLPVRTSSPPIPGKFICDPDATDEDAQSTEFDDAGLLPSFNDAI